MTAPGSTLCLDDLRDCFEGVVPAVIATAGADGTPNITYLSRVRYVDPERVALSNQFFSKTAKNLIENPRASVLVIDPVSYDQYRLSLVYERTDRRGPLFERLRDDVDVAAALHGMQDVFHLRAADIYRVVGLEQVLAAVHRADGEPAVAAHRRADAVDAGLIAELTARLGRCADLDAVVGTALAGLAELFGHEHSLLLLADEDGRRLFTIASHGYDREGVGSEVVVGDGLAGLVAERCRPLRVADVRQLSKYVHTVRREHESAGRDIPVPGLADAKSQLAVPAMALGSLVGVLLIETRDSAAYGAADEAVLTVIGSALASVVDAHRARERLDEPAPAGAGAAPGVDAPRTGDRDSPGASGAEPTARVRFYDVDGSVFIDGDYLIKGVAGRILWSLLGQHHREGRTDFTNREVRLDPALDLPPFRDNFESRLILLKRRLDERAAPLRIDKTGRGRFRLVAERPVALEAFAADGSSPGDPVEP